MAANYYSTNKKTPEVDFFTAILTGQAPDRGLYMPKTYPQVSRDLLKQMASMEYSDVAARILGLYITEIPEKELRSLCQDAYSFWPGIETVSGGRFLMRLDTGPTASFKDFAAQMMSRLMSHKLGSGKLVVLTATSGDTGSAIAQAFHNIANIEIVVLFPINEVSATQRKQMTTLSGNVQMLSVNGKFDDCQAMVKEAFADKRLAKLKLTSANSINIARLLPQAVYYFWAYAQLIKNADEEILFSVPSGNFGDLMGAAIAWKMGLPIRKLIVATNANDEFPRFLSSGKYQKIEPSKTCISNAMNVGHPSNLARLIDLFGGHMDEKGNLLKPPDLEKMVRLLYAVSVSDDLTRKTIFSAYKNDGILLEPHGAVGWYGLEKYLEDHPEERKYKSVSLETAHPGKFPEEIEKIVKVSPELPSCIKRVLELEENYQSIEANYEALFNLLKAKA